MIFGFNGSHNVKIQQNLNFEKFDLKAVHPVPCVQEKIKKKVNQWEIKENCVLISYV